LYKLVKVEQLQKESIIQESREPPHRIRITVSGAEEDCFGGFLLKQGFNARFIICPNSFQRQAVSAKHG